ncbi:type I phosphomannose isomerase catalytic subunit [Granulicella sp. L46]|uniref:type I phosphomannose isomerase catalytic subunit n=1 Tax=Granulicella sp. L46 TaxID=1641865 RepID=UPI00131CEC03|nr:type I phosphomannose isomerase catalytic subunit [Granulicella sp. L46]
MGLGTEGKRVGPVSLRPIFSERIWGVETLPKWYPQPEVGKPVGEAWLTAETCVVDAGEFAGASLAEMTRRFPEAFAGGDSAEFPLLVKTLFPRQKLSVQVHPNDAQAGALGLGRGKTECWYVLSAEPGAELALGFRGEISNEEIKRAIADGTLEEKLNYLPVKTGDMVFVDAGTVHSIGPGMVILETQEYSDITYRLYDFGRPRELHVDAGLAVTRTSSSAGLVAPVAMDGFTRLVASDYFVVDRFAATNAGVALGLSGKMQMLFALGEGVLVDGAERLVGLDPWRVLVLPAEGVEYSLRGVGEVIRIAQP